MSFAINRYKVMLSGKHSNIAISVLDAELGKARPTAPYAREMAHR